MIKFFRQIRFKLMSENKTSRYFKYAFGEIILVVIGILIALQINNWNENRKLLKSEKGLLTEVIANLEANKKMLESGLKFNEKTKNDYEIILKYINNNLPYDSIVKKAFHTVKNWHSPFFTYTAYESLKSKGLDIIHDDSIKEKIAYIYEYSFAFLVNDYDKAEWTISESVKLSVLNKYIIHVKGMNGYYYSEPVNFDLLKKGNDFINLLSSMVDLRSRGIQRYKIVIKEIDSLNKAINKYLN